MNDAAFSVVISTYNRRPLVGRAIRSVLNQEYTGVEVIVIDDCSTDGTLEYVQKEFPTVRYFRLENNQGAGAARNRGIREAKNPWVVILDDDDELLPDALGTIAKEIASFPTALEFPVLQFAHGNGEILETYMLVRLEHYLNGVIKGDFIPVINKYLFISKSFAYPEIRSVGEHLLWWRIAHAYGIPTWNKCVALIHDDAPIRLTSPENQIHRARDYAELQERTLQEYGEILRNDYPALYRRKCLGAGAYWLLAGEVSKARKHLWRTCRESSPALSLLLIGLSFLPHKVVKKAFLAYRRGFRRK